MKRLTPLAKGAITGTACILITLALYKWLRPESSWNYSVFAVYLAGIVWTLISYRQSGNWTGTFGDLFSQGFRSFIIVTLMMVLFTGIFQKMHPEFAAAYAEVHRKELAKDANKTPGEIAEAVEAVKKQYPTAVVYSTIFGYLMLGAAFTAMVSGLILIRKK